MIICFDHQITPSALLQLTYHQGLHWSRRVKRRKTLILQCSHAWNESCISVVTILSVKQTLKWLSSHRTSHAGSSTFSAFLFYCITHVDSTSPSLYKIVEHATYLAYFGSIVSTDLFAVSAEFWSAAAKRVASTAYRNFQACFLLEMAFTWPEQYKN